MSAIGLDDTDMEFAEYDGGESGELWDDTDSEDYDAESRSSERQRRARQQRIVQARRRQAQASARARAGTRAASPVGPAPATPQQAVAAIRNLDLDTKVQEDNFRRATSTQNKRMSRSEYAAVAGAATTQFIESFHTPDNPYAKAALRFAPLLLLSPQRKGTGLEGFLKDPRVIGGIAVLGITVVGETRNRSAVARQIDVLSASELAQGEQDVFVADVLDGRGTLLVSPVSWTSSDPKVASIDSDGRVTAKAAGAVVITAKADGIVRRVRLKVTPAAGQPAGGGGNG